LGEGRFGDSLHAHPLVLPGLVLLVLVTAYAWTSCVFPACPVVRIGAWHRRHTWILLAGGCAVSLALAFAR
jgi:hypothetical protein